MRSPSRVTVFPLFEPELINEYLEILRHQGCIQYPKNTFFTNTLFSQLQNVFSFNKCKYLIFAVKNNEDGNKVGVIICYIDLSLMTVNLEFFIVKNNQSNHYASESLHAMIHYLGAQFPGMKVFIEVSKGSIAFIAVAMNHGFTLDGDNSNDGRVRLAHRLPRLSFGNVPVIPDFITNASTIGIAAYDAGGAEQITWLLRNVAAKVYAYVEGPAKKIFENSGVSFSPVDQISNIMKCDLIITGSGWMSQTELSAIMEAKIREIPCITILDHWTNYLERFRRAEFVKPQALAVMNYNALELAQKEFPNSVVWLLPDFQVMSYQDKIRRKVKSPDCVLIILEPILNTNSKFAINENLIEELIHAAINVKRKKRLSKIIIRPHPAQINGVPSQINFNKYSEDFEMSKEVSLLSDLEVSKVVLGMNSYALYISTMCEIDTYSTFAKRKHHWTQKFPKISQISKLL